MLWALLTLCAGLQAPPQAELDLPGVLARAPIVVLARVADPRMDVQDLPALHARQPYQRMRRHLDVLTTFRGHVPAHLRVDEPHWAARYAAWQQCRAPESCPQLVGDRYRGQLAREPNPGAQVLVFLRRNAKGELELAADFALDRGERAAEVQALLQAKHARGQR